MKILCDWHFDLKLKTKLTMKAKRQYAKVPDDLCKLYVKEKTNECASIQENNAKCKMQNHDICSEIRN